MGILIKFLLHQQLVPHLIKLWAHHFLPPNHLFWAHHS
jgi:hypothetical protein